MDELVRDFARLFGEEGKEVHTFFAPGIVRIGEFSWHLMERTEGDIDFSFFDEVVKKLKENGLSIMFGTPTATFPAWLAKKHPDILSKDEFGRIRVLVEEDNIVLIQQHIAYMRQI